MRNLYVAAAVSVVLSIAPVTSAALVLAPFAPDAPSFICQLMPRWCSR